MSLLTAIASRPRTTGWHQHASDAARAAVTREYAICACAASFGAMLGLSAPGLEQWYLAWFGVIPLIFFSLSASEPWTAWWRGLCFGTGYNLVYMMWYLFVRTVYWKGCSSFDPAILSVLAWLAMSIWQGLLIATYACILKAIPMVGGWLPAKRCGRWLAPSFFIVPLLWLLIMEKLGNAPEFLGVPWSMLEYSQYKQLPLLQCACITGGYGIAYCILLANIALLGVLSFMLKSLKVVSYTSYKSLLVNTGASVLLLMTVLIYGSYRLAHEDRQPFVRKEQVSAIQASLVQRVHHVPFQKIVDTYLDLATQSPQGLIVWPECAFDIDYTKHINVLNAAADTARRLKQSWVIGVIDTGGVGKNFNAVCGMDKTGAVDPHVYHKRYLVPVGEYIPEWARRSVAGFLVYGFNGKMRDTDSGRAATVFRLKDIAVTPVLCFENIIPRLVCDGVKSGAELIVDCSSTCWFDRSIVSDQMVAICVIRAVENHRPFILATALGPSTIIDAVGNIVRQAPAERAASISANITVHRDLTPFTRWCF